MKKIIIFIIFSIIIYANSAFSGQGCCSWHDGECGCVNGRIKCCDGTLSPTCKCDDDDNDDDNDIGCFLQNIRGEEYLYKNYIFRWPKPKTGNQPVAKPIWNPPYNKGIDKKDFSHETTN